MEKVGDIRKKWKDLVRQTKAHSGLSCQWKKKSHDARTLEHKMNNLLMLANYEI
jgi:hypothetical protein